MKSEFNGVVTGGDGLQVPLDIGVLLDFLDEVQEVDNSEAHEDADTCEEKASNLPFVDHLIRNATSHLKEHSALSGGALRPSETTS